MTTANCLVCSMPTTKICSSCKTASYCNNEHQKKDWRSHKEYCLKVKAADNTFDAILFAVNETKPRLIKIPWEFGREDEDDNNPYHKLDKDIWFKQSDSSVRPIFVERWGINRPKLDHRLCFMYNDNFGINGSPLNRCVDAVTGGKAGHQWCGNILALRMRDSLTMWGYDQYKSVNMEEDLKLLVTYFEEYGKVMPAN